MKNDKINKIYLYNWIVKFQPSTTYSIYFNLYLNAPTWQHLSFSPEVQPDHVVITPARLINIHFVLGNLRLTNSGSVSVTHSFLSFGPGQITRVEDFPEGPSSNSDVVARVARGPST